jgi:hypothetical protein
MNIDKLKKELVKGQYDADPKKAADKLNALTVSIPKSYKVTDKTLLGLFGLDRGHNILLELERMTTTKVVRLLSMIKDRQHGLDIGHPDAGVFIDTLIPAVFTVGEAVTLKSLGTELISRATQIGLTLVKAGHIEEARR